MDNNLTFRAAKSDPAAAAAFIARKRARSNSNGNAIASLAGAGAGIVIANSGSPSRVSAVSLAAARRSFSNTPALKIAGPTPTLIAAALGTALPFGAPSVNPVSIGSSPTKDGASLGPQTLSQPPKSLTMSLQKNGKKDCCCCDPCGPKNGNTYTPDLHSGTTLTQYPSNYTITDPGFWTQTAGKHSKGTYTGASGSFAGPGPAPTTGDGPIIYT